MSDSFTSCWKEIMQYTNLICIFDNSVSQHISMQDENETVIYVCVLGNERARSLQISDQWNVHFIKKTGNWVTKPQIKDTKLTFFRN